MMPHHQHEQCDGCRFIRSGKCGNVDTDWYVCGNGPLGAVIGRYGSAPSAYWSMPVGVLETAPEGGGSAFFEEARRIVKGGPEPDDDSIPDGILEDNGHPVYPYPEGDA